jgi:hypothetical protein
MVAPILCVGRRVTQALGWVAHSFSDACSCSHGGEAVHAVVLCVLPPPRRDEYLC